MEHGLIILARTGGRGLQWRQRKGDRVRPRASYSLFRRDHVGFRCPWPDPRAQSRAALSHLGGDSHTKAHPPGLSVRSAAVIDDRLARAANLHVWAPTRHGIRSIHPTLGLLVLGLDQRQA